GAGRRSRFASGRRSGARSLARGPLDMILARRGRPATNGPADRAPRRPSLADWIGEYRLADREHRVRVTDRSPLAGKTLEELRLRVTSGAGIVAIERDGKVIQPTAKTGLRAGGIGLVYLFAPDAYREAL